MLVRGVAAADENPNSYAQAHGGATRRQTFWAKEQFLLNKEAENHVLALLGQSQRTSINRSCVADSFRIGNWSRFEVP